MADHLGNALFRPFLPQFVSDRFRHPVVEYLALAAKAGLAERVDFIDGGDPLALMAGAMGAIVVNSTAGLHALQAGCPAKCLGIATYDIGGITHQRPACRFLVRATPPRPRRCGSPCPGPCGNHPCARRFLFAGRSRFGCRGVSRLDRTWCRRQLPGARGDTPARGRSPAAGDFRRHLVTPATW